MVTETERPQPKLTIAYPGAKGRLARKLVAEMPQSGHRYVEPFAGRGNVFFEASRRLNFNQWWLNDTATAPFFAALKDLDGACLHVPERTRRAFERYRALAATSHPHAILLEPYLTFSGGGYKRAGFGSRNGPSPESYARTLRACSELLARLQVTITALDWQCIDFQQFTADDFVFLDPPYMDADVRAYRSNVAHVALVEKLKKAKYRWMLTEYGRDFYFDTLGKPFSEETVQLACDGRGKRRRTECVWKNY